MPQTCFPICEASQVAAARRGCVELAAKLGLDETLIGRVALVTTEAATNILKHAGEGAILVRDISRPGKARIEIIAIDSGPGISNLQACLSDGFSTADSQGTGLGAMRRLSESFDAYTMPGLGSAFRMTICAEAPNDGPRVLFQMGAVCLPIASEEVCGDAWHANLDAGSATIMVADGLGHGPDAMLASQAAIEVLKARGAGTPTRLLELTHEALRATRGAAVAVARIDLERKNIVFAGIGNIAASLQSATGRRQMMSHNGIVGNNIRKIQEFTFPWAQDDILILHSDGLGTHWDLRNYPGLEHRHPALIAAMLHRDHARMRDDVTIVAVKNFSSV